MTEDEWLAATNPTPMLELLKGHPSDRKLRLLGCIWCREIWDMIEPPACRQCVEVAERFADKNASAKELQAAFRAAELASHDPANPGGFHRLAIPSSAAWVAQVPFVAEHLNTIAFFLRADEGENEYSFTINAEEMSLQYFTPKAWEDLKPETKRLGLHQAISIRCAFGNPFRPVAVEPAWLTSDVLALARGIYDDRAFDRMPILADALQDAGCNNDDVLNHCRDANATHVRGCWLVDLVLGKA